MGSVPNWETKILPVTWCSKKKKKIPNHLSVPGSNGLALTMEMCVAVLTPDIFNICIMTPNSPCSNCIQSPINLLTRTWLYLSTGREKEREREREREGLVPSTHISHCKLVNRHSGFVEQSMNMANPLLLC